MYLINMFLNGLRFEAATDGGAGTAPIMPPTTPAPTVPPTAPTPTSGEQEPTTEPGWLKKRLDEAHKAGQTKLLKELGFEKGADLKAILDQFKTEQDAKLTESEQVKNALQAEKTGREQAEAKLAELQTARLNDKVDSAITAVAQELRAEHPQDVIDYLRKSDVSSALDDKGEIVSEKVKTLVEQAKKDRPGWFRNGGVGVPSVRDGVAPEALAAEKEKARRAQAANLRNKF